MAIINNENVNDVLRQLLSLRTTTFAFIGMTRENRESWFYLDNTRVPLPNGGSINGFHNWGKGEPNNLGRNEECGSITTTNGRWNDIYCGTSLHFICEKGNIINRYFAR